MGTRGLTQAVVRPAFRLDRAQLRPLIGIESATSIAIPLAIGLLTDHTRAGAWAAIGAFLTSFAVFQPGYRIRARVVVVASVIVAVGTFLGAVTGIEHIGIFPVVAAWTFLGGLLVAVGPNATVVGVVSSVGLMIASSINASPSLALEDGILALCGGLGAAILVPVFHQRGQRAEAGALAASYRVLADYASGIAQGEPLLPDAATFDTLAATLAVPGSHRYRDRGFRDRALATQAEQLRTALAALTEAHQRQTGGPGAPTGTGPVVSAVGTSCHAVAGILAGIARSCGADAGPEPLDQAGHVLLAAGVAAPTPGAGAETSAVPTMSADSAALLEEVRGHMRVARELLDDSARASGDRPRTSDHLAARERGLLSAAVLALRANLTLRSTACRHALRLAAVATVATVLYRVIDPLDGYWIVVAVLFVLKPDFGSTIGRSILRVVGTIAGVTLTTLLLASLRPGPVTLAVLTVVTAAFAYTLFNANYGAFAVFLTCLTVFLAAFLGLPPMMAVANRTVDNLIGSGLTILAFVVWPTWVATAVPGLVARCLAAQAQLGDSVLGMFIEPASRSDDTLDHLIVAARLARSNAEAAAERMAHEPYGIDKGTLALASAEGILAQMHRVGLASLSLRLHLSSVDRDGIPALAPLREQLAASFSELTRAVETDTVCPPSGLPVVQGELHHALEMPPAPVAGVAPCPGPAGAEQDARGALRTVVLDETDLMVAVVDVTIDLVNDGRVGRT